MAVNAMNPTIQPQVLSLKAGASFFIVRALDPFKDPMKLGP